MKKILVGLGGLLFLAGCDVPSFSNKDLSLEEIKIKVEEFVNANMMKSGTTAVIKEVEEEGGLYKIELEAGGQEFTTYISKDGANFFPQAINLGEFEEQKKKTAEAESLQRAVSLASMDKQEKPEVELFVMSHCPYGTQTEKGILPVLDVLGDKIDFKLKFVDYVMHGETEAMEQLNQHCIQQEEPEKLQEYLGCFLVEGKGEECLASTDIDMETLETCVTDTDEEFGISVSLEDKASWRGGQFPAFNISQEENKEYGVQGSPTLVINGKQIDAQRDSKSLLETICAGFEEAPEECGTELPATQPSPGFGFNEGTGPTAAQCS